MPVVIAFRVAGARQPTRASTLAKPSARMGWDLGKPRRHPENVIDLACISTYACVQLYVRTDSSTPAERKTD